MIHPPCDCGHEFEADPRWFHLGFCAYRRSFMLRDGTRYYFARATPASAMLWRINVRDRGALRRALAAYDAESRRATRVPVIRAAYRAKKRGRRG